MWVLGSSWWVLSRREIRGRCVHSHILERFILVVISLFMSTRIRKNKCLMGCVLPMEYYSTIDNFGIEQIC